MNFEGTVQAHQFELLDHGMRQRAQVHLSFEVCHILQESEQGAKAYGVDKLNASQVEYYFAPIVCEGLRGLKKYGGIAGGQLFDPEFKYQDIVGFNAVVQFHKLKET